MNDPWMKGRYPAILCLTAMAAWSATARADLYQGPPNPQSGATVLPVVPTNTIPGSKYDSAVFYATEPLAAELWTKNPANQTTYGSLANMVGAWSVTLLQSPEANVYHGWYATLTDTGAINFQHVNGNPDPGGDYTEWTYDSTNNRVAFVVSVPNSQLASGQAVALDSVTRSDAMVVRQNAQLSYDITGYDYLVVPEPTTLGLLLLGSLTLLRKHRPGS